MTIEEKRIKFAEWMGWKFVPSHDRADGENYHNLVAVPESWVRNDERIWELPRYDEDLNAMHEAKKRLSENCFMNRDGFLWNQKYEYLRRLELLVIATELEKGNSQCNFEFHNPTAMQEFECVGQAVGLWEGER